MDQSVPPMGVEELAAGAGVRVRTVRFYIAEGLLPGPGARGRSAAYGEEHLLRLRLIRRLAERRVPLAEMRARLAGLSLEEVRRLLQEEERATADAAAADSASEYVGRLLRRAPVAPVAPVAPASAAAPSDDAVDGAVAGIAETHEAFGHALASARRAPDVSQWRRWTLAPGVELHVREDVSARHITLMRRLREVAAREVGAAGGGAAGGGAAGGGAAGGGATGDDGAV